MVSWSVVSTVAFTDSPVCKLQGACEKTLRACITLGRSREPLELVTSVTSRNVQRFLNLQLHVLTDKGSINFFCNKNSAGTGEGRNQTCMFGWCCWQPHVPAAELSDCYKKVDSSVLESYTPSIASRKQIWYEDIWNALWNNRSARIVCPSFLIGFPLFLCDLLDPELSSKTSLLFPYAKQR